ncbi:creatininase family protein [Christensenellaceae bacterium NSJ-44]|uniref:Creatininase family protein n=1 Tax=Luoshenia tenuis TaxID=2763654 RepID=A0A926D0N3_9FIRM|nr:creatininase family protein [Luoshenia tenuis]MBC8529246.1 creatininase family protein [Luoshenia tenuis]
MRTVRYELMRPEEVLARKAEKSVVYLPIGPVEWHGLALPFGTDPLWAQEVARQAARVGGGVVMPTLFLGTERERSPADLHNMGFEDTDQYVVGMDFPGLAVKSMYAREEVFSLVVREQLRMMVALGYKLIVLVNGHGATNQGAVLERLAREFTGETESTVMAIFPLSPEDMADLAMGHATLGETAGQLYLHPDSVDLTRLPPKGQPLEMKAHGMADGEAFAGRPNADFTVQYGDPREATAAQGEALFNRAVDYLVAQVEEKYRGIE